MPPFAPRQASELSPLPITVLAVTLPALKHQPDRRLIERMAVRHNAGEQEMAARDLADDLGLDQVGGREIPGALDRLETLGYIIRRRARPHVYRLTDAAKDQAGVDPNVPPFVAEYEPWRHGGWYVTNVRYPSGAVGCVSRNYADGKWRIACDPRPGFPMCPPEEGVDRTYRSRDAAAFAEKLLVDELHAAEQAAAPAQAPVLSATGATVPA